ncbi:dUTP diphosphatase [Gracilibacillus marinus]|jgi:dimeric dUTPase (all-alpha-NTP-PPase superfamily)|uniref:dUTP diphosphatase n=1 Tax=Gracilibacillus marinus TaxID=630535 RepID=A0ABV8VX42_9BACI
MNWNTLFTMQYELDQYILKQHDVKNEEIFDKKLLALLVEVGELANETRCFKYWSLKPPSEKSVIAEEYVDGIHFILSLGLALGIDTYQPKEIEKKEEELTTSFLHIYEAIQILSNKRTSSVFYNLFDTYLQLGLQLGFTSNDIKNAYMEKNKINFERQNSGY